MRSALAALFSVSLLVGLMGASVLLWTRDAGHYAGFERAFRSYLWTPEVRERFSPAAMVESDAAMRRFVSAGQRDAPFPETPIRFNEREVSHLRDVAAIYGVLQPLVALAALLMLSGLWLERRTVSRVAVTEAGAIVALGVLASVAFRPAFLLFHRVLFPQGNFLFDPATDNLVQLYPEVYWLLVTLAVGVTFVLVALVVAGLTALPIRSSAQQPRRVSGERVE